MNFLSRILVSVLLMFLAACAETPRKHDRWLAAVSPGSRTKLLALRQAVKNEPAVRAAREQRERADDRYHEALRAAILKRDPSVARELDKIRKRREDHHKKQPD